DQQQKLRSQRIGDYLTGEQIVTPEQLVTALKRQQAGSNLRLGDALIQEKLITPEQLEEALSRQRNDRKKALGEILIGMGIVDEATVRRILAKKLGIPFVDVRKFRIDINTIQLVPLSFVSKYTILPLYRTDKTLIVAMEDPMNWAPLDELRFLVNLNIAPVMALREDIQFSIDQYYKAKAGGQKIGDLASELINEGETEEAAEEAVAESDNTLVRLVNKMIMDAYHQGASDIHIETYPGKRSTRVRFRKDGSLVDYFEFPPNFRNALISRIKIMARLNISEKRRPQDGKIEIVQQGGGKVELRVATIPTANGLEDVVLRVLAAAKAIPMEDLDLAQDVLERVRRLVIKPYGLFLMCGPTGSGKTTTLHSVLGFINTDDRKIWTAEDPVEITQEGLRQVQVNPNIGWTF
ncbi:MAG TPA: ATPase, T2SS/T4P/T4SS family, partial [Burkholderiales bacterium]|nr:ATPase, T2SS/T4P/T4SS family [Burkholderiales bacterium]